MGKIKQQVHHEIAALLPPICSVLDAAERSDQLGFMEVMRDTTLSYASQLTLLRCSAGINITTHKVFLSDYNAITNFSILDYYIQ